MQSLQNRLMIAGGLIVLGSIGTVMNHGFSTGALRAADGGPTVTIGGPLPVPTMAAQSGVWNVGITGTPNVAVANSPTVVVDDAREPVQRTTFVTVPPNAGTEPGPVAAHGTNTIFLVPAGKRLVIEYASAQCNGTYGPGVPGQGTGIYPDAVTVYLTTQVGNTFVNHFLPFARSNTFFNGARELGANFVSVGNVVRLYADPGTNVLASVQRYKAGEGVGDLICDVGISGHLVSVTPGIVPLN
jgi:hypothetical protein